MGKSEGLTVGIVGFALATTLILAPSAYPAGQPVTDYEISLHELGKVKKVLPAKKKPSDRKKRKKTAASQEKTSPVATIPKEVPGRILPPSSKENVVTAPPIPVEPTRISHDPYSYLVAGKQTVILAVISSAADVKSVYCKYRGEEKGADALAPMTKVDGTQYTYRAILPGLASSAKALHYRLVVVDALGKETQSPEFSTVVKASPVIPGWQLEDSPQVLTGDHAISDKQPEKSPGPVPPP